MKRTWFVVLLLTVFLFTGCATMDELTTSISTKVISITSHVDQSLVAKIPEDKKGGFPAAEFAVKAAEEKLKLAQLKTELATKQKKYAQYEEDLADIGLKNASLDYDIIKQEAINATPGLGKKEDNTKALTNLKLKKNELEKDKIRTESNIDETKQQMSDLTDKIKEQEEKVKGLSSDQAKPKEKAAAAAETDKADKGKGAEEKSKEKAPIAPPEKTQ
jgi:chromosome segregation ATPase